MRGFVGLHTRKRRGCRKAASTTNRQPSGPRLAGPATRARRIRPAQHALPPAQHALPPAQHALSHLSKETACLQTACPQACWDGSGLALPIPLIICSVCVCGVQARLQAQQELLRKSWVAAEAKAASAGPAYLRVAGSPGSMRGGSHSGQFIARLNFLVHLTCLPRNLSYSHLVEESIVSSSF